MKHKKKVVRKENQQRISRLRPERYFQLKGELKLTVLHPKLLQLVGDIRGKRILDFGCGDGKLTHKLMLKGGNVLGVDKSKRIIDIARGKYGRTDRLKFEHVRVHEYTQVRLGAPFDVVILSLVTITIKNWEDVMEIFKLLGKVIRPNGKILFGETHPCYHHKAFSTFSMHIDEVDYSAQNVSFDVEIKDGYTPDTNKVRLRDVHRSLHDVTKMFRAGNFCIKEIHELYDDVDKLGLHKKTVASYNGSVPPFIIIEAEKHKQKPL